MKTQLFRKIFNLALVAILLTGSLIMLTPPQAAYAAMIVVNSADDNLTSSDGYCTLREAIMNANAGSDTTNGDCIAGGSGADTINFDASLDGVPITLSIVGTVENANATGDLDITADLTILGNQVSNTIIDGGAIDSVFHVIGGANVIFKGLIIRNGTTAGIYNDNSTVQIDYTQITGNSTDGIMNYFSANTYITFSEIDNNNQYGVQAYRAAGGGNYGVDISYSTIHDNAQNGVQSRDGRVNLVRSAVYNNSTGLRQQNFGSGNQLHVYNSTISNNGYYGLRNYNSTVLIYNSTIIGHTVGTWMDNYIGSTRLYRNIIANNTTNCAQAYNNTPPLNQTTDYGYNLDTDATCVTQVTSLTVAPPLVLGTLQDNGGPTPTHALLSGSPAIDVAPTSDCTGTDYAQDQRGAAHDYDGNGSASANECDLGAYELRESITIGTCTGPELSGPQSFDFASTNSVAVTVNTANGLNCITVEEMGPNANHLAAGTGIQTGNWWHISGNISSGFETEITLPFSTAGDNSRACRWPGNMGGDGWDCDDGTYTTNVANTSVTRTNVDAFSDWSAADGVTPTAITLQSFSALGAAATPLFAVALGSVLLAIGGLLIWKRHKTHGG